MDAMTTPRLTRRERRRLQSNQHLTDLSEQEGPA